MSFYSTTVDTTIRNSSQTIEVELVGADVDVLDVGCASGYLGVALKERGCRVSGVEYDPDDARRAAEVLDDVRVADLNATSLTELFGDQRFDRIVFGDVLEHLLDPERVLADAVSLLRENGTVVISVPNVAHASVRLALLQGRWTYTDTGLLDRTHVQMFTHDRLMAMVHAAGLAVTDARATVFDALTTEVDVDGDDLPPGVVDWVRSRPFSDVYQFVVAAGRAAEVAAPEPTVVEPADFLAPAQDAFTAEGEELRTALDARRDPASAVAQIVDLRHRLLVARDHAVGQEAQLGALRSELAKAASRERFLHKELHMSHEDAKHAHAEWAKTIAHAQGLQAAAGGGLTRHARRVVSGVLRRARAVARPQGR